MLDIPVLLASYPRMRPALPPGSARIYVQEYKLNRAVNARGLPGYTFERSAGEPWRSRYYRVRNLIIVNSGHRDFVFATRSRALQLRYLVRLYVKELVLQNFVGLPAEQMAERMVAMKAASDNAGKLINELQLIYNKARQAAITKELSEIVGGAAAV